MNYKKTLYALCDVLAALSFRALACLAGTVPTLLVLLVALMSLVVLVAPMSSWPRHIPVQEFFDGRQY